MSGLLFGTPKKPLSLRDDFRGSSVNRRIWRTITDGGSKLSVGGGRLVLAGGSGTWNDPSMWRKPIARSAFGGVVGSVRISGNGLVTGPLIGWSDSAAPTLPTGATGAYSDYPDMKLSRQNATVTKPGTRNRSIDYQLVAIPRVGGGNWVLLSGGVYGTWPTGTLVWIDDTEAFDPVYVPITNKSGIETIDFHQPLKPSQLPAAFGTRYGLAVVADTFTGADGTSIARTPDVGTAPAIQGQAITIQGNKAVAANGGSSGEAVYPAIAPPAIYEVSFTTPSSGTIAIDLRFRATSNYSARLAFVVDGTIGGTTQWRLKNGGSQLTSSNFTFAASTTYRLRVVDWATHVNLYVNDTAVATAFATTANNTNTYAGFVRITDTSDNGSTFDNFAVYPLAQSLPPSVRVPSPPAATGAALLSDTFTGVDGTNLIAHTPDVGGSWRADVGSMEISSNKARVTASATQAIYTIDTGVTDHEVAATITTPNTTPVYPIDWYAAVFLRWTDADHYIVARIIYQSNAPEVEVWEHTSFGIAKLDIFTQFGAPSSIIIAPNTAYTLKAAVVGSEIAIRLSSATVTDELVGQGTTTLLSGTRIGIGIDSSVSAELSGQPLFDSVVGKAAA